MRNLFKKQLDNDKNAIDRLHALRPEPIDYEELKFLEVNCDLSIIVPVYNAGKYIDNCITSIINQKTYFTYEIILINDGSTDKSLEIIQQINSPLIKIFSIQNCGAANARNFGLSKSCGKYIMFVDADDELLDNAIEILLTYAEKTQTPIIQGNYYLIKENCDKKLRLSKQSVTSVDLTQHPKAIFKLEGYPWGKVFKRDLFIDAPFPNLTFEDTLIWMTIYHRANNILILPNPVYNYRIDVISETSRISEGNVRGIDTLYVVSFLLKLNQKLGLPFNNITYQQLLFQFGKLMYIRNYKLGKNVLKDLISVSKNYLINYKIFAPKSLSIQQRLLKMSIYKEDYLFYKFIISTLL